MTSEASEKPTKAAKKAESKDKGPKVIAVFSADCRATKGHGTTVAVVQGGSGKCRLYGRNSLANAFPEQASVCKSLSSGQAMADHFSVRLVTGKAACDLFMAADKLEWDGKEAVLADAGKGDRKRGGFRSLNYATF